MRTYIRSIINRKGFQLFKKALPIIAAMIVVIVLVSMAFSRFIYENRQMVVARSESYIKDFTLSLADKLNSEFSTAQASVKALADLMGDNLMDAEDLPGLLKNLEEQTGFDYIRFVDIDGISHTSSGTTADVSERSYFLNGIHGLSGTTFVTDSVLTNQRQIGFYAPVKSVGIIKGVMVVFFEESTFEDKINYWFYEEKSAAGIITTEGQMIVNSPSDLFVQLYEEGVSENINEFIYSDYVDEENREKIENAYRLKEPTDFEIIDKNGAVTYGYMAPLDSVDLNVYMTFPSDASEKIFKSGVAAGRRLQISLIIIFSVFALYISVFGIINIVSEKKRSSIFREKATTDELTGVYNRRAYEMELDRLNSSELPEDIIYIEFDLNGLKLANDNVGHAAGDELIIAASECMVQSFGKNGNIFRTGGDEFVAIVFADEYHFKLLKNDFDYIVSKWRGKLIERLYISYGCVFKRDVEPQNLKEMAMLADKRMYEAKAAYYKNLNHDRRNIVTIEME